MRSYKFIFFSLLITTLFLFSLSVVNANTCVNPSDNPCWIEKTPIPTARRDFGIAVDATGKIYTVGGHNGFGFTNILEVYDPATETWVTKRSAPSARNNMGFTFNPSNGKFYLAGGYNGSSVLTDFYEYDPYNDKWTTLQSLPSGSEGIGLRATTSNGKIYIMGGINVTFNKNVHEYDPSTNRWTVKNPMPTPRADFGLITALNGKIYAIGGGIIGSSLAIVDEYDPISDSWNSKAPMSKARAGLGVSLNANANIYSVGGNDPNGEFFINLVEEYNTTTNTWTTRSSLPTGVFAFGLALGGDGKVYALGGWTPDSSATNTNYAGFIAAPYFSQNELPWGPSEYDHTYELGITGKSGSMDWWGCAVTSIAMVLKYHNLNQLNDGTLIDPDSLNKWLKNNNGYLYGFDKKSEWYSYLDWSRIGKLTEEISTTSGTPKLEWRRLAATDENLNTELSNYRLPVIMVKNADTNMHFVMATGKKNDTFSINDPEWNYPDLTNFNKNFYQIDSFTPSQTNLSYLLIVINPDLEILATDPLGNKTGRIIEKGITKIYNEIPQALYSYEGPISNPGYGENSKSLGTGVNSFILPTPTDGNYTITLSSKVNTFYTINISATEKDGNYNLGTFQGSVASNNDDIIIVKYSQDEPSELKKSVTFESTLKDVKELRKLNLLHFSLELSLIADLKSAEKLYKAKKNQQVKKLIDFAIKLINTSPKKFVDPMAKEVLLYDFNELRLKL